MSWALSGWRRRSSPQDICDVLGWPTEALEAASRGMELNCSVDSHSRVAPRTTWVRLGRCGFIGRWRGYANGHGGNAAMRDLAYGPDRYRVWVLETVGSSATYQDVCDLESLWKEKLGSRAKGLNRN